MVNLTNVVLVDENDAPLGTLEKLEAHRRGLLHRAFSVMLYRKNPASYKIEQGDSAKSFPLEEHFGLTSSLVEEHSGLTSFLVEEGRVEGMLLPQKMGHPIPPAPFDEGRVIAQSPSKIEVLLQQRALTKYHGGGLWANTCCSHPFDGESVEAAAYRRLQEEVFPGVKDVRGFITLNSAGSFIYRAELDQGLIEHEFDHVFVAEFLGKGGGDGYIPSFNPQEIATMEWIDLEALINQLENPQNSEKRYAPWLKEVALKTLNFAKQVSDS